MDFFKSRLRHQTSDRFDPLRKDQLSLIFLLSGLTVLGAKAYNLAACVSSRMIYVVRLFWFLVVFLKAPY